MNENTTVPEARTLLQERLEPLFEGRLASLVLTRNRRRILSVRPDRRDPNGLALRLDHCFLHADDETLEELAQWALASNRTRPSLERARSHFEQHQAEKTAAPLPGPLQPEGEHHDLRPLFADLNQTYFEDKVDAGLTWGSALRRAPRMRRRTRRESIRLGSYDTGQHRIRIHRVLDHPKVPQIVLESVLHHEMIHAVLPPEQRGDRRYFHTPEFRQLEQRYAHQAKANRWIQSHLNWLLRNRYRPPAG